MVRHVLISRTLLTTACKIAAIAVALAVRTASGAHGHEAEPAAPEASVGEDSGKAIHGVSLGEYRIRSYYQVDAQKSTVRFSLFATVKDEHFRELKGLVEEHQQKLRDQIIMATRQAPLAVFQEPDLATFRRRVLIRLRRALPELNVEDLYVSEFDLTIKSL
jgi:hypothetical protein